MNVRDEQAACSLCDGTMERHEAGCPVALRVFRDDVRDMNVHAALLARGHQFPLQFERLPVSHAPEFPHLASTH